LKAAPTRPATIKVHCVSVHLGGDHVAKKVGAARLRSGPSEIAFNTEDEGVPLIICPEGTAAQKARAARERVACAERIAPGGATDARPDLPPI
jgi:hypothetical protein